MGTHSLVHMASMLITVPACFIGPARCRQPVSNWHTAVALWVSSIALRPKLATETLCYKPQGHAAALSCERSLNLFRLKVDEVPLCDSLWCSYTMQHGRVQHSTGSRFTEWQPTHLLYTTNVGQQGTGWTVINQVAEVILHTCMRLYFL